MGGKVSKYRSDVILVYLAKFLLWDFLAQHQIPMQLARIYRAWLPSDIYSVLFSPILQHYHISERFRSTLSCLSAQSVSEEGR